MEPRDWGRSSSRPSGPEARRRPPSGPAQVAFPGRVATPSPPPRLCQVDRQGAPYHLLWVLHRARMLLDVYLETEGVGGGATAAVCGTLCNRRVRGRDRRKPFHFSKTTSQFDQAI